MNFITKFFHELFNPHCEHCEAQREIERHCNTCEVLKMELAKTQELNKKLFESLNKSNDEINIPRQEAQQAIIQTRKPTLAMLRNKLETESRLKAEELRNAELVKQNAPKPDSEISESVKELEKELGIDDVATEKAV